MVVQQALVVAGLTLGTIVALRAANVLVDRGFDPYLTRRVPAVWGGAAFLAAVLWLEPWVAMGSSAVAAIGILAYRIVGGRNALRGVAGSGPAQSYVELTYVGSATISLLVGWTLLGDRWLAFVPIAFMAWGDTASALVGEAMRRRNRWSRGWSTAAMLTACLGLASLYSPYWIGAVGAVTATVAEQLPARFVNAVDDNWLIVGSSLGVMAAIEQL